MLDKLTTINTALSCLLHYNLQEGLLCEFTLEEIPSLVKDLRKYPDIDWCSQSLQKYFLLHKDFIHLLDEGYKVRQALITSANNELEFSSADAMLNALDKCGGNLSMLAVASRCERSSLSLFAAERNKLYGAPPESTCMEKNVWRKITWNKNDIPLLESDSELQLIAQFLCEHLCTDCMSEPICAIQDKRSTLSKLIRTWFDCGKDPDLFSKLVLSYAEYDLLDLISTEKPLKAFSVRYPEYTEFIDYVGLKRLQHDVKALITFALLNEKTAFLRFMYTGNLSADELSGTIITQRWFRKYIDINGVTEATIEQLLELPSGNIYRVSEPTDVNAFLELVY